MSDFETRNNSGYIFKNDHKTSEKMPDYKGKIVVDGSEKQIALWLKVSPSGVKYLSVAISEPFVKQDAAASPDDLPF
jgi:uncharacterized protein (DUF736 family)